MPLARDVVKDVAVEHGACIRPIQLRRTDLTTGQDTTRARPRAGTPWRLCARRAPNGPGTSAPRNAAKAGTSTRNPSSNPTTPPTSKHPWIQVRADAQAARDADEVAGEDATGWDEELAELDDDINEAGMRGNGTAQAGRTAAPLDQAAARRPAAAQAGGRPPHRRQDLHGT